MGFIGAIGYILGLSRDNGKDPGNYYLVFAQDLGFGV